MALSSAPLRSVPVSGDWHAPEGNPPKSPPAGHTRPISSPTDLRGISPARERGRGLAARVLARALTNQSISLRRFAELLGVGHGTVAKWTDDGSALHVGLGDVLASPASVLRDIGTQLVAMADERATPGAALPLEQHLLQIEIDMGRLAEVGHEMICTGTLTRERANQAIRAAQALRLKSDRLIRDLHRITDTNR